MTTPQVPRKVAIPVVFITVWLLMLSALLALFGPGVVIFVYAAVVGIALYAIYLSLNQLKGNIDQPKRFLLVEGVALVILALLWAAII